MTDWLTPADVARSLQVSKRTVLRWIDAGTLPALRVGSVVRVSRAAFAEWCAVRESGNSPQQRQASAPAAATVARPVLAPVGGLSSDYTPVFGGLTAGAASSAARRSGSATRNEKAG